MKAVLQLNASGIINVDDVRMQLEMQNKKEY